MSRRMMFPGQCSMTAMLWRRPFRDVATCGRSRPFSHVVLRDAGYVPPCGGMFACGIGCAATTCMFPTHERYNTTPRHAMGKCTCYMIVTKLPFGNMHARPHDRCANMWPVSTIMPPRQAGLNCDILPTPTTATRGYPRNAVQRIEQEFARIRTVKNLSHSRLRRGLCHPWNKFVRAASAARAKMPIAPSAFPYYIIPIICWSCYCVRFAAFT